MRVIDSATSVSTPPPYFFSLYLSPHPPPPVPVVDPGVGRPDVTGALIGLAAAMLLADLFFRSRHLTERGQTRALAMASYSSAPLAWLFIPLTLFLATASKAASEPTALGFTGYVIWPIAFACI